MPYSSGSRTVSKPISPVSEPVPPVSEPVPNHHLSVSLFGLSSPAVLAESELAPTTTTKTTLITVAAPLSSIRDTTALAMTLVNPRSNHEGLHRHTTMSSLDHCTMPSHSQELDLLDHCRARELGMVPKFVS